MADIVEDATITIIIFRDIPLMPKPGYTTSPAYNDLVIRKDLS